VVRDAYLTKPVMLVDEALAPVEDPGRAGVRCQRKRAAPEARDDHVAGCGLGGRPTPGNAGVMSPLQAPDSHRKPGELSASGAWVLRSAAAFLAD
jgi:hypothetical protein